MIDVQIDKNTDKFNAMLKTLTFKFPVAEIAEKTGFSKGSISEILKGKRAPSDAFLSKFIEVYNITDIELFETKLKEQNISSSVPYYDIDFTAGFVTIENNTQVKPDAYITHPFFKGCDYVVRASGQSMAKVISHGDAIGLIKVENWHDFFPFGEIYAIVTKDGFRMVKIITKGDFEDTFTLISKPTYNKRDEFPPQQIKKSSILSIFKVQASSHLF